MTLSLKAPFDLQSYLYYVGQSDHFPVYDLRPNEALKATQAQFDSMSKLVSKCTTLEQYSKLATGEIWDACYKRVQDGSKGNVSYPTGVIRQDFKKLGLRLTMRIDGEEKVFRVVSMPSLNCVYYAVMAICKYPGWNRQNCLQNQTYILRLLTRLFQNTDGMGSVRGEFLNSFSWILPIVRDNVIHFEYPAILVYKGHAYVVVSNQFQTKMNVGVLYSLHASAQTYYMQSQVNPMVAYSVLKSFTGSLVDLDWTLFRPTYCVPPMELINGSQRDPRIEQFFQSIKGPNLYTRMFDLQQMLGGDISAMQFVMAVRRGTWEWLYPQGLPNTYPHQCFIRHQYGVESEIYRRNYSSWIEEQKPQILVQQPCEQLADQPKEAQFEILSQAPPASPMVQTLPSENVDVEIHLQQPQSRLTPEKQIIRASNVNKESKGRHKLRPARKDVRVRIKSTQVCYVPTFMRYRDDLPITRHNPHPPDPGVIAFR